MKTECRVSIILPVRGSAEALDRTVSGVLGQTETRWRLWLVESAQAPGSASHWVGRDERIQVLQDDGGGRAAALRAGLAQAEVEGGGLYTVLLDTEHCWAPGFLALTAGFLASQPLMDMVCTLDDAPQAPGHGEFLRSVYQEGLPLHTGLEPTETAGLPWSWLALSKATWYHGELAGRLGRGEYTRLAVTLMTETAVAQLRSALAHEDEALDYRLQSALAQAFAVNLLALPCAIRCPVPVSPQVRLQQEVDALAVFDDVHGRRHEVDAELARLRRERLLRIRQAQAVLHRSGDDGGFWRLVSRLQALLRPVDSRGSREVGTLVGHMDISTH